MKWWTRGLFLKYKEKWDWRRSRPWKLHAMTARFAHEGPGKVMFEFFNEHIYEPLYDKICCEVSESESEEDSSGSEGEGARTPRRSGAHSTAHGGEGGSNLWDHLWRCWAVGPRVAPAQPGGHERSGSAARQHTPSHGGAPSPGGRHAAHERQHSAPRTPLEALERFGANALAELGVVATRHHADAGHGAHGEEVDHHGLSQRKWAKEMERVNRAMEKAEEVMVKHAGLKRLGLLFVYTAWAIMVWIIFVYGKLIYNLYGQKTEEAFVKNWGVGLAIEQAQSFQELVRDGFKAVLVLVVLDLIITGPGRWFEEHVDFLSVQGTLLKAGGAPSTWGQRMYAHLKYYGNSRSKD